MKKLATLYLILLLLAPTAAYTTECGWLMGKVQRGLDATIDTVASKATALKYKAEPHVQKLADKIGDLKILPFCENVRGCVQDLVAGAKTATATASKVPVPFCGNVGECYAKLKALGPKVNYYASGTGYQLSRLKVYLLPDVYAPVGSLGKDATWGETITNKIISVGLKKPSRFVADISPIYLPKYTDESDRLFQRLFEDPSVILSKVEREHLQARGQLKPYKIMQMEALNHPVLFQTRKAVYKSSNFAIRLSQGIATGLFLKSFFNKDLNIDEGLKDPNSELNKIGDDEVELWTEYVPFPHIAMRAGNLMFSYGVDKFSVSTVNEYLSSGLKVSSIGNSGKDSEVNGKRLIKVIRLKLGKQSVDSIKEFFANQDGKTYKNVTFVNDCARMIVQGMAEHTTADGGFNPLYIGMPLVNASPSQVTMYLDSLGSLGNKSVSGSYVLSTSTGVGQKLADRVMISTVQQGESYMFIKSFLKFKTWQAYIDATNDHGTLAYFTKEDQEGYAQFKEQLRANLESDQPALGAALRGEDSEIKDMSPEFRELCRAALNRYFKEKNASLNEEEKLGVVNGAQYRWIREQRKAIQELERDFHRRFDQSPQ